MAATEATAPSATIAPRFPNTMLLLLLLLDVVGSVFLILELEWDNRLLHGDFDLLLHTSNAGGWGCHGVVPVE